MLETIMGKILKFKNLKNSKKFFENKTDKIKLIIKIINKK